jgi:hypothetical protein
MMRQIKSLKQKMRQQYNQLVNLMYLNVVANRVFGVMILPVLNQLLHLNADPDHQQPVDVGVALSWRVNRC